MCRMNFMMKMSLMKRYESYWNLLPEEMRCMILSYRDSQELVDRRESVLNGKFCEQIREYGCLRQKWQIGPIRFRPIKLSWVDV